MDQWPDWMRCPQCGGKNLRQLTHSTYLCETTWQHAPRHAIDFEGFPCGHQFVIDWSQMEIDADGFFTGRQWPK